MSNTRRFPRVSPALLCLLALTCLQAGPSTAATAVDDDLCLRASILELDDTLRVSPSPDVDHLLLRVEAFEPGLLSLAVTVPGSASAEPVLVPVTSRCGEPGSANRAALLNRTRTSLLVEVDGAGPHYFRLSSASRSSLPELRVGTLFLPGLPPPGAGDGDFATKADGEIEMEADPLMASGPPLTLSTPQADGEIEMEADPLMAPGSGKAARPASRVDALCARGQTDDHGDVFPCATTLTAGKPVDGELANDWGDDADVFRFVLPGDPAVDLWRVDLTATGATDTFGVVFDRAGRRLAESDLDGKSGLTEVLPPGVYFVRVEGGAHAEGRYRLELEVSAP